MTFADLVEIKHPRPWLRTLMHRLGDCWGWSIYVADGEHWRRVAIRTVGECLTEAEARGELALNVLDCLSMFHSQPRLSRARS